MSETPGEGRFFVTSTTLLEGLRDPSDHMHWQMFVDRYRPLLLRAALRLGLKDEDAEDVAQEVLLRFCTSYREGRYERDKGRLRSWLYGILRHRIQKSRVERGWASGDPADPGSVFAETHLAAPPELEKIWEEEWRQAVVQRCLEQIRQEVRESTWEAFRQVSLEERSPREVAAALGLTEKAVYGARQRVLQRVAELRPLLEEL